MKLIHWIVIPIFYVTAFPICCIIALMDHNNGRGFRKNLGDVMGAGFTVNKHNADSKQEVQGPKST